MDKRYQVFVSSTYTDLKEERQRVLQVLMEMDCIPAGMELFPAADEEQWQFIKKVIDDCDYYLLIIGGRYGSLTEDGISYTEKEFDYAIEKGIKVIALIHGDPNSISVEKSELDPKLRNQLEDFKRKVATGRLVKNWQKAEEIPGLVALSLSKTIKLYPATGWVRASNVPYESLLLEINELRKRNTELTASQSPILPIDPKSIEDIVNIDSQWKVSGSYNPSGSPRGAKHRFEHVISWKELFLLISPYLLETPNDSWIHLQISKDLLKLAKQYGSNAQIHAQDFNTIKIQLLAYGLISIAQFKTTDGGTALFWSLTEKGKSLMMKYRVIRK